MVVVVVVGGGGISRKLALFLACVVPLLACFSTVATGAIQDKRLNSFSNEIQNGVECNSK